nr:hypothetical protein [uncultured Undibacterium sp.]
MSQRAEYISKMEAQLLKLNQKMSSLESEAQEAKEEARQTYKEEMAKLRLKSKGAIAKLEELKASSEDSWETMVSDMKKMHDAFTRSFFQFSIPLKQMTLRKNRPTQDIPMSLRRREQSREILGFRFAPC